jgi:RNA polymerase sigma factor (sigma-70 family)
MAASNDQLQDENARLCATIQRWAGRDTVRRRKARERLLEINAGMIQLAGLKICQRYPRVEIDDAVQECRIWLLRSAETYNAKSARFSTYAMNGMLLFAKREAVRFGARSSPVQVDVSQGEETNDWAQNTQTGEYDCELLPLAIASLSREHASVLKLHYGIGGRKPKTLKEIASLIGVSMQRAQQIKEDAVKECREAVLALERKRGDETHILKREPIPASAYRPVSRIDRITLRAQYAHTT